MIRRIAVLLVAAVAIAAIPRAAAAGPLAALPAFVRVNVAELGVEYAKIGSTGSLTATLADGTVAYRGYGSTITRLGVRRLADSSHTVAVLPDPVAGDERRNRITQRREARLAARLEDVAIVTIPFEFSVEERGGDPFAPPLLSARQVVPIHFVADDGLLTFDGRAYRGTLELARDDEGDMIVVNEVDTANYLASVVGSEEPSSWMPEALAAQAIAARTYLITHLRRHGAYDLEGDTRDQEYDGLDGEAASTVRAVEHTRGLIATFRGAPIEALYSANAGGFTEDSENVYANALPYLRAVPSPHDDVAEVSSWGHASWQWQTEFTTPQLGSYLSVRGIDIGDPQRIELTRLTGTGRVIGARIFGTRGGRDIGKDAARYYFGLRSTLFTVSVRPEEIEILGTLDADRIRELEYLGARLERILYSSVRDPERSWSLRVTGAIYRLPARFLFAGRGYGHGVGMSQWGAQGMALAGASAGEILTHYYQGIEITGIGGS